MIRLAAILLFLTGCVSKPNPEQETMFMAELYVQSVKQYYNDCAKQPVIWGFKGDSICFAIDDIYCFTNPKVVRSSQPPSDVTLSVLSTKGKKHYIRYIRSNDGFIIFITNLEYPFPQFTLSSTNICR